MVVAPVVAVVRTVVVSATGKRRRNSEYGQCNGKLFHLHSLLCVLPAGHYSKTQWTAEAANGAHLAWSLPIFEFLARRNGLPLSPSLARFVLAKRR